MSEISSKVLPIVGGIAFGYLLHRVLSCNKKQCNNVSKHLLKINTPKGNVVFRTAVESDMKSIHQLVIDLAVFEKAEHEVKTTIEVLKRDGFHGTPAFQCIIAETEDTKKPIGLALYFYTYSTWTGKCIHLEDLYVSPEFRASGVGQKLIGLVTKAAYTENCARLQWQALDWNEKAIGFYKHIGADHVKEWETFRFTRDPMKNYLMSQKLLE